MKTQVAPYATSAKCLRIECADGTTVVRLTRYPVDLVMSNGAVYQTGSGFDFTGAQATSNFAASAIDLEGFLGFAGVTRDTIASGVFDNARCYLFACDFLNPVEDYEPIVCSILGKTVLDDEKYTIEEMGLIDALNQSVGDTYAAACPKRLGGQEYAGCKKLVTPVTGTLTHVSSAAIVRDATRGEAADWFGAGTIRFASGANAGLKPLDIKSYAADGTITTFEPCYYPPQVGDAYEMMPGCRKRLADCRDKWDNVVNFGGFSNIPTSSSYQQVGAK